MRTNNNIIIMRAVGRVGDNNKNFTIIKWLVFLY